MVSLFTNVSANLLIQIAKGRLESDDGVKEKTKLTTEEVLYILKFHLYATYCTFPKVVYRQKNGTTMGSPMQVTMANLVMEGIPERALETYHTGIPVWK